MFFTYTKFIQAWFFFPPIVAWYPLLDFFNQVKIERIAGMALILFSYVFNQFDNRAVEKHAS
jgi:hypothetical protein